MMVEREIRERPQEAHIVRRSFFWGAFSGAILLSLYFLVLSVANSFSHALEQFRAMWHWIALLVAGFALQSGLYTYIRATMKMKRDSGVATSTVAAAGGISTTSMVACCAHHVTDVFPLLGLSAAVIFFNRFQSLFLTTGVLSNLIGITLMLRIIQEHSLYAEGRGVLSRLMKLDMKRSFYGISIFSAVTFLVTLYISI
ncbi:hypothetical protein BMS3Bbin06_01414 [bacterium BMS3Bbin06]|nr:hypothetical protein BMS3Abin08_01643 [bacterium BMS3Abin08]GBE34880.1 hypothetical protein BMS3Bbin06_01414 [bacterium BMS3Bbin06]HDO36154.1 hypothetical protein [Nitrospirota bacterium]HDY70564.1 hypothetical protein [Nitrospirota bacterium]